ncbi:bifunctional 5,10-methylenetetrahydrofolate dehydrogenase/5,10-methenyltetrahydrofolate cyclohydrolase [Candidatus Parcubacteria bacterium]|nr:bifunctional 5,10-methylenetetrahydrofolate dehydrogenase/5,10-methenyltetrahydrofolate cyclohydrolase [Candidatus Parcubacteria bacterium]
MSVTLDGKKLRDKLSLDLIKQIRKSRLMPKIVIVQVGDLKESNSYIKKKMLFAKKVGAVALHKKYPENISQKEIVADIRRYNSDKSINGIMVQLPIPARLDSFKIVRAIDPSKDVDGLTGKSFTPATTQGILTLLKYYKIAVTGKKVVIVGDSELVGRPTHKALKDLGAHATLLSDKTKDLAKKTKTADILIVAVGKPGLIGPAHVNKNQVVIDVGITVLGKKVVGDVDYKKVKGLVRAITPVPGGVGPMTVYSLFENLLKASAKVV